MIFALWYALACADDPNVPQALAYDHVACDACAMMVSDPMFAVQMSTKDGSRYEFDDPACAFRFIADKGPDIAHVWFRDSTSSGEAWLDWQQVAFVPATGAPMDGGLKAVPVGTSADELSFSAASRHILGGSR